MAQAAVTAPWEDYAQGNDPTKAAEPGPWADYANAQSSNPTINTAQLKNAVVNNLPTIGGVAGGLLGNVPGAAIGGAAGQAAQDYIGGYKNADGTDETTAQKFYKPLISGGIQGIAQGIGNIAAPVVSKMVGSVADPVSDWLGDMANEKIIEATGATGKQALDFVPDAGQKLRDMGIGGFGKSQASISGQISDALEKTGKNIGSTLADLDAKGATVDQADIINSLRQRASELGDDPSQFSVSDSLNKLADRLQNVLETKGGETTIPLSKAEMTKRGFQTSANYNSAPLDLSVSKEAANIYRQAVEDAATKFDPSSAANFQKAKQTYAVLSPIEEAAAKRASTLAQSPKGGLLDTTTAVAGAALGGGPGAVALPIARRMVADRIAPSLSAVYGLGQRAAELAPATAQLLTPPAAQGVPARFGLMAPPPPAPVQPPNYSTVPGRNGQ